MPPGVPGSVVLTNLSNMSTPIIRYSGMGDVAVFDSEPCPCGDRQPLLKVVEGRLVDSLVLGNGKLVHPFTLTLALENIPLIAKFQIVQERLDSVRVLIVPETRSNGHRTIPEEIRQSLRKSLGERVQITVDLVTDIPEMGKPGFHTVKSLVPKKGWD
jgi:phenylacetate-CoA ligase